MQKVDALSLCEEMATGLAVCAADLRVRWVNPALADWLEQGPARLCGQHLSDLAPQAPDLLKHANRCIDEARASRLHDVLLGNPTCLRMAVVELTPHAAGGLLMEVHEPVASGGGLALGLRGLAHELRNPLSGLRGAAQLLERRLREPALCELAVLIREEADRLESLASRLLQPGDAAPPDSFNVHAVLERAATLIEQETAPRRVVERDYDPALPPAFGNPQQIEQIVLNLLQNALQA
ncbi:MAG TPA: PAS domain-containing sensor histidine kinase, partial [Mizugakiibacter sp.]|nr:PAS domain-containing sensor histidine kinase [Mizugakiibacter sp.]